MAGAPDAVVVGAGIVGAAVAWGLAQDGLQVDVLDRGFAGGGATGGGMGHIVVLDDSAAQFALSRYSAGLLADLADSLSPDVELDACGTLWIAEDDAQLDLARRRLHDYTGRGVAACLLDARELADVEPELRPGLAGALHVPDDVVLYPPALCRWLLDRACERGARVRCGVEVMAIEGRSVLLRDERVMAAVVVNAAGSAAARLTPGIDVLPRKGHLVITDRYPGICRHQLVELGYLRSAHALADVSVAFNIQPRRTGQVLIGSSRELVGWDARVNRTVLADMLARATSFVPRLASLRATRSWTAFRPATRDGLPYIGRWQAMDGVWIAAGHEGLGVTTALGTGLLLADLIAGRTPRIDPAPYAAMRGVAA